MHTCEEYYHIFYKNNLNYIKIFREICLNTVIESLDSTDMLQIYMPSLTAVAFLYLSSEGFKGSAYMSEMISSLGGEDLHKIYFSRSRYVLYIDVFRHA